MNGPGPGREFFALALSEHRLWGLVFIPMILKQKSEESFYFPDRTVFVSDTDEYYTGLTHTCKEIVRIVEEYNDQNLFKLFSKHKNIKEFQENVNPGNIENFIRPYIEKRLSRILSIVKGTNIRIFQREKTRANIFDEDFLVVSENDLHPNFNFIRGVEGSGYSLFLKNEKGILSLKDRSVDIISNSPAVIRVERKVYFISKIEAKKLKPFFTRNSIHIPVKTEKQYFKSFVSGVIRDHEVNAEGFEISVTQPDRRAILTMERGLRNNAVLLLRFFYGKKAVLANSEQEVFVDFFADGGQFRFEKYYRDQEFESTIQDQLNSLSLDSFDQVNYELRENRDLPYEEQVYGLVEWVNLNFEEIRDSGILIQQKTGLSDFYLSSFDLKLNSEFSNDWFDIFATIKAGEFEIPFIALRKNILEGTREFPLPDGNIFILPLEWFARFRELFEFGKVDDQRIRLHKQHFFILEKAEKGTKNKDFSKLEILNRKEALPFAGLPRDLDAQLRPYQVEGYTWLSYLQQQNLGGCLADDMGLGKTLQAISLLQRNKESLKPEVIQTKDTNQQLDLFNQSEENHTSLVVVPASLVHNWINEIKRFAPGLKTLAYTGLQRSSYLKKFHKYDVIVSTYHTIRQDIESVSSFRFHYVILDESQVIKNPSSKVYKAVQLLNSKYRLVLTGTPIENSLTDLWAQMNFINNGLLGSLNFFKREYVNPIEKKNDVSREKKLKQLINPFILRRKKEEVARELPELSEQVIYCNMTDEQRKIYEEEKSSIRNSIFAKIEDQGLEKSAMIVLQGLTRLRQISNHPRLVDDNYRESSGKFEEIIRNIENIVAEGHKALVFSSFVRHLEIIRDEFMVKGLEYTMLTGESIRREDIISSFQENPECRIFLISLKAGGVGLNLTAADYVFILDPWWNPASEDQAVNRAHRIGQDKNVFVYRFISVNSIEEKIQKLQEKKSRLAENFVRANNPLKDVSKEELKVLFE